MARVAMIDYGMGNLHSAVKALEALGASVRVTQSKEDIRQATHVVLPGVGAFPDAMQRLQETGMDGIIKQAVAAGKPFLGICLGMQLMLSTSSEGGLHQGLGILPGAVTLLDAKGEKIPHMGWNEVTDRLNCPLLKGVSGRNFYFVHSFCVQNAAAPFAAGITEYGQSFASLVWDGRLAFGAQFHPEKSSQAGRQLLQNFLSLA